MIPTSEPKLNRPSWCVVRQLPNMQRSTVARFHSYRDADGYLWVIKRLLPDVQHTIVFEPVSKAIEQQT